ncbi:hypothetical protein [Paenibacillus sp. 22594]|uniref:hypothetical protein n=1 Tax=Paenibacillus sp. 22594 TaxID=3453947 RepID=UPI003F82D39F
MSMPIDQYNFKNGGEDKMEQMYVSQTVRRIQKRLSHSNNGAAFKESIKEAVTVGVGQHDVVIELIDTLTRGVLPIYRLG